MVVLLAARAVLGPSIWLMMTIFGIMLSPAFFRLVYASVTAVRNELYVDAARVFGISDARIIGRHILVVVRAPALVQAAVVAGIAIGIQSGLEFLGLGDLTLPTGEACSTTASRTSTRIRCSCCGRASGFALTCISLVLFANALRDVLQGTSTTLRKAPRHGQAQFPIEPEPVLTHADPSEAPAGEELLAISHLAIGYDQPDGTVKTVVEDVSLTVRRGEVHGLIGESGSGKTQTAWSVLRLLPEGGRVVGGSIVFEGTDLARVGEKAVSRLRGKRIAYVPQEPMSNLDPSFTIGSQLVEPIMLHMRVSRGEARDRALGCSAAWV